jgi:hypothetical protein
MMTPMPPPLTAAVQRGYALIIRMTPASLLP